MGCYYSYCSIGIPFDFLYTLSQGIVFVLFVIQGSSPGMVIVDTAKRVILPYTAFIPADLRSTPPHAPRAHRVYPT